MPGMISTLITLVAIVAAGVASPASPKPLVNTIADLYPAIVGCWHPPPGTAGSEVTLRFGLDGKGALRGLPMVTYSHLFGPHDVQKAFVVSALQAVSDCTPLRLTDSFARIVAQQVLSVRFVADSKPPMPPI